MAELKDVDRYVDEWTKTQLMIWREKIERMHIIRSGALHESFVRAVEDANNGDLKTITLKFLKYGLYQAYGVGRGYYRGNPGDLEFLDKDYRKKHGLDKPRKVGPKWGDYKTSGKPREERDWYSKKLYLSTRNMVEDLTRILGEEAVSVIKEGLEALR